MDVMSFLDQFPHLREILSNLQTNPRAIRFMEIFGHSEGFQKSEIIRDNTMGFLHQLAFYDQLNYIALYKRLASYWTVVNI